MLARGTPGFSGADLANMVNEAALVAARQNRKTVLMWDFEQAKDKVLMGAERKSMLLSDEEKKVTAYHEAGHALVAALREHSDPLHKVTIIPRGMALGVTMQLPIDDKHTYTRDYLETRLAIMMGGRVAEELFLQHHDHRRRQRHRAGVRPGPQDGLRVRHVHAGADDLRQEGRADLPGPRDQPASRLQRGDGAEDRPGSAPLRGRGLSVGNQHPEGQSDRRWKGSPWRCWSAR